MVIEGLRELLALEPEIAGNQRIQEAMSAIENDGKRLEELALNDQNLGNRREIIERMLGRLDNLIDDVSNIKPESTFLKAAKAFQALLKGSLMLMGIVVGLLVLGIPMIIMGLASLAKSR